MIFIDAELEFVSRLEWFIDERVNYMNGPFGLG